MLGSTQDVYPIKVGLESTIPLYSSSLPFSSCPSLTPKLASHKILLDPSTFGGSPSLWAKMNQAMELWHVRDDAPSGTLGVDAAKASMSGSALASVELATIPPHKED